MGGSLFVCFFVCFLPIEDRKEKKRERERKMIQKTKRGNVRFDFLLWIGITMIIDQGSSFVLLPTTIQQQFTTSFCGRSMSILPKLRTSKVVVIRRRMIEGPSRRDEFLDYSIDSFLRGDYDRPFADDAAAPLPGLTPRATVEQALRSFRALDDPEPSHGAAVLLRFCVPLSRGERWGGSPSSGRDQWKEILRGALTPTMLARRIRASDEFSGLLDWKKLDVTEGTCAGKKDIVGLPSLAFVNAALYFEDGMEPTLVQFTLRRLGGVWLIDTARRSDKKLFVDHEGDEEAENR